MTRYIKYGKEWRKEVLKNRKEVIADMFARVAKERDQLGKAVIERDASLRFWLETYDITMPCGHKNRYAAGEGLTHYCVMCELEARRIK